VKAVVADLYTAAMRLAALEACRQAAAIVEKRDEPAEAQAFKRWLVSVAQEVAEAATEGGFLAFGGTRVTSVNPAVRREGIGRDRSYPCQRGGARRRRAKASNRWLAHPTPGNTTAALCTA
jgi:hypothetical protein